MATNFLEATGGSTAGYFSAVTTVISSELVSLGSSLTAVSASTFTSSGSFGQAIWGEVAFTATSSMTMTAGAFVAGWFLRSLDGGTVFESTSGSSGLALGRSPDFIIPYSVAAYASSAVVFGSGLVKMPWSPFKVFVFNGMGATLPASTNGYSTIKIGPVAVQY